MSITFPLPEGVEAAGPAMMNGKGSDLTYTLNCDNLFLAFYRFVPEDTGSKEGDNQKKRAYLSALAQAWPKSGHVSALKALHERRKAHLAAQEDVGKKTDAQTLWTNSRMVAGLGYDSPLEVGMSLHPLHGIPYLPGSSVKGIARSWAEQVLLPRKKVDPETVESIFGHAPEAPSQDQLKGEVTFLDALPAIEEVPSDDDQRPLEIDVMTPHYGKYYTQDQLHGDWHQPTPVPFLTVAADVPFQFSLIADDADLLLTASNWLRDALSHLGAGGKTRAGYGYFALVSDKEAATEEISASGGSEDENAGLPGGVEPLAEVDANTTHIPAEVIDYTPGTDQAKVRLYVEGYEEKEIPCNGMSTSGCGEGDFILVRSSNYQMNRVFAVRFQRSINQ